MTWPEVVFYSILALGMFTYLLLLSRADNAPRKEDPPIPPPVWTRGPIDWEKPLTSEQPQELTQFLKSMEGKK